jgi:preprotein translocase subunit SecE
LKLLPKLNTGVAQLVEHWSPKPGVGRSSRSSRANKHELMKIVAYLKDTYNELVNKVTWPSWDELQESAIVVMIASFIFALIIAVMDISFKAIIEEIYAFFYNA